MCFVSGKLWHLMDDLVTNRTATTHLALMTMSLNRGMLMMVYIRMDGENGFGQGAVLTVVDGFVDTPFRAGRIAQPRPHLLPMAEAVRPLGLHRDRMPGPAEWRRAPACLTGVGRLCELPVVVSASHCLHLFAPQIQPTREQQASMPAQQLRTSARLASKPLHFLSSAPVRATAPHCRMWAA